jgi:hypothetical protein
MNPDDTDADQLPPQSPEEEAEMQREIEIALEPYRKIAPASLIPTLRESLERALRTHPVPRQLIKAFAPRKSEVVSGDRPVDGSRESDQKAGGKDGA